MNLPEELAQRAIKDVVKEHPPVGEILSRHDVACVTCQVGICLFKDVLAIHGLKPEEEAVVEAEINGYLNSRGGRKI